MTTSFVILRSCRYLLFFAVFMVFFLLFIVFFSLFLLISHPIISNHLQSCPTSAFHLFTQSPELDLPTSRPLSHPLDFVLINYCHCLDTTTCIQSMHRSNLSGSDNSVSPEYKIEKSEIKIEIEITV